MRYQFTPDELDHIDTIRQLVKDGWGKRAYVWYHQLPKPYSPDEAEVEIFVAEYCLHQARQAADNATSDRRY